MCWLQVRLCRQQQRQRRRHLKTQPSCCFESCASCAAATAASCLNAGRCQSRSCSISSAKCCARAPRCSERVARSKSVLREDVCGVVLLILKQQLEADTEQVQVRHRNFRHPKFHVQLPCSQGGSADTARVRQSNSLHPRAVNICSACAPIAAVCDPELCGAGGHAAGRAADSHCSGNALRLSCGSQNGALLPTAAGRRQQGHSPRTAGTLPRQLFPFAFTPQLWLDAVASRCLRASVWSTFKQMLYARVHVPLCNVTLPGKTNV